ncbi:alpha/beta fold hydrolase [Roseateles cellulosilyticus]|uniref:Alpha/beta hydrolase n=1 Tax=Pelomonas cellulosilytica TaxID=2906762 RepID=A0ABS8XV38_9BURK|nr:alpha/beta hydrolase [Pelomonas sp. P8]MCE4556554.1 alpha/beta hydrolase [Pelomonas sp. P8]
MPHSTSTRADAPRWQRWAGPLALSVLLMAGLPCQADTAVPVFPESFAVRDLEGEGATLHVRIGGQGRAAVVLLHGFGETGDMWAPLAARLAERFTVIIPDLRGMGLSARPEGGYDKKTQARQLAAVLDGLGVGPVALVTHDIGNMVGYAFAAQYPGRVTRFAIIDAPLPGIEPWTEIARRHAVWHWSFWGADAERLVAGRERIYLDRFWNEFAAPGNRYPESWRGHYAALYGQPGAMRAAFEQFKAFDQDAVDNRAFAAKAKLSMPVLAVGGGRSYGTTMAAVMRNVADDVTEEVIAGAGHWVLEERPAELIAAVRRFLEVSPLR